jgi:hypothetical protein
VVKGVMEELPFMLKQRRPRFQDSASVLLHPPVENGGESGEVERRRRERA